MIRRIQALLIILFISSAGFTYSQSCANYTVTRNTGTSYSSISGLNPSFFSWRNTASNQDDDNRSYQEPIGFDFWYLGVRYTQFSANLNGTIDFSSSTSDGNNGGNGPYGPNYNNVFSTAGKTMLALAPLYDDLWTAGSGTAPVATSIFFQTSGTAPNRVLTIEWQNFDKWNSSTGSLNFQVKIYETTGVIEFLYGNMTAGSTAHTYTCGINGTWASGAPTVAQLLTQQTANTTAFSNTPQNSLATLPASNSKLTFTPPVPGGVPTGLSFSAISKTGMTVNWTDNANNEVGYVIYHSMDNIDFIYAGETTANATSAVITGLLPSTTYYWKVHAVTEGDLGSSLTGTQATLPAGTITSVVSGNWLTKSTWDCNCIPTAGDDVTIANGHTVTLNGNGITNKLTVGQGVSGQLIIGNNSTGRTLTIDSDLVIHTGAVFTTGATSATHTLIIDDDIINNGTFDLAPTSARVCNVSFMNNTDSDQVVSGAGSMARFNRITVNMLSSANKVEITASNFSAASNFLTLTNGSFKLSTPASVVPFTGNATIPLPTGIWLNHSGATMSTTGGNITLIGFVKITAGTFDVGNSANNNLTFDGGSLTMQGGSMNIAGRMDKLGLTALTNFTMSAGTLTVATVGSTTTGIAPFSITETNSSFNMSGGTIIIRHPGAGNLGYVNTGGNIGTVSGGVVQIGDNLTSAGQTFHINSSIPIPNLVISNGVAVTAQIAVNPLIVYGNITINSGTLDANNLNIDLDGNFINNGNFISGNGTFLIDGTLDQTLGGSASTTFNNLTVNTTALVTQTSSVAVNGTLTLTAGKIAIGNYNLTIAGSGSISGGSASGYIIATGSGSLLQQVAGGSSKIFPVGTTSDYMPATVVLTGASTPDNISVRVKGNAYSLGETGMTKTTNAVSGTWVIDEAVPGGSNATLTFQWPQVLEMSGFNRSFSRLAHFTAGAWEYGGSDISASGTNPYSVTRSGFTSFSPFAVSMFDALPVTWLSFNGRQEKLNNYLYWTTADQVNNAYFEVQVSVNGFDFESIGRVPGAINAHSVEEYYFIHENVKTPLTYYRIRQVDIDGRFSYSTIVKIEHSNISFDLLQLAPNPVISKATLSGLSAIAQQIKVKIFNWAGQPAYSQNLQLQKGYNAFNINLSRLAAGIYVLETLDENGEKQILKFVKY